MLLLPSPQLISVNRCSQGTARSKVRKEYLLLRRDYGRGLSHEMDPTKHDHIGLGPGRNLRQSERIANIIGDILDFRDLIIVRYYDRVPLTLEPRDLRYKIPCTGRQECSWHQ